MAVHAINKQSFEFFCNSEAVAQSVQYEIEHYTAFHINSIISSALDERDEGVTFTIDRLEIDLGNIQLKEFGNADMLNRFREIFNEKLLAILNEKKYVNYYKNTAGSKNGKLISETTSSEIVIDETDFELLEFFLLKGDIPWWGDKNAKINFDAVIQKLAKKNLGLLKKFLTEHKGNTNVLSRLYEHSKPQTVSLIHELIPGIMPGITSEDLFTSDYDEIPGSLFSNGQLEKIKRLRKQRSTNAERQKIVLQKKIIRLSELLFAKYWSLNFPSDKKETLSRGVFKGSLKEPWLVIRKKIETFINKLTVFQVEFLLFQLSLFSDVEMIERINLNNFLSIDTPEILLDKLNDKFSFDHKHATRKSLGTFFLDFVFFLNRVPFDVKAAIPGKNDLKEDFKQISFAQTTIDNIINEDGSTSYSSIEKSQSDQKSEPAFADEENLNKEIFENDNLIPGIGDKDKKGVDEPVVSKSKDAENDKIDPETTVKRLNKSEHGEAIKKNPEQEDFSVDSSTENQFADITNKQGNKIENLVSSKDINNNFTDDNVIDERIDVRAEKLSIKSAGFPDKQENESKNSLSSENVNNDLTDENVINKRIDLPAEKRGMKSSGFTDKQDDKSGDAQSSENINNNFNDDNVINDRTDLPARKLSIENSGFTNKKDNKSENFLSSENINDNFNDDGVISRKIEFLVKKLKIKSPAFTTLLKQLRRKDIDILFERFKKRVKQTDTRKRNIENILEHPYFLQYNLLKLSGVFTHMSAEKGSTTGYIEKQKIERSDEASGYDKKGVDEKSKITQSDGAGGINKKSVDKKEKAKHAKSAYSLMQKELIIVKDVFYKARFDSESEKKIVRKLLLKLPDQNIALLKFFTELPREEIQRLSVSNKHILEKILLAEKQTDLYFNQSLPEKIYIENSGLCLVTAYLPRFFRQLGYLENNVFKNKAVAARAVYVLQYIINGKNKNPEYMLQLNKLLCGFETEDFISASVRLTKKEMKEADDLLTAVIEHWKALRKTSIQGFRQSFLQRKGILSDEGISWRLQVERKGFDILLGTIPWGFGILKLPWMKKHIQVEW